jgi:hypothetical protein
MRRLVMIILLVLMPLQFSWAAWGAYCPHETGSSARQADDHNHKHAHLTDADQENHSDPHATGSVDADSGLCHAGHGTAIFGSGQLPAVSVLSFAAARTSQLDCPRLIGEVGLFLSSRAFAMPPCAVRMNAWRSR